MTALEKLGLIVLLFPPWRQCDELRYEFKRLYNRQPVAVIADSQPVRAVVEPVTTFILPTGSSVVSGWYFHDSRFPADGPQHTGLDYACELGDPIYAAASGTVVWRGWDGDFGNTVTIQHVGGWETRYCHLSAYGIGGWVGQGAVIGYCGLTGLSTGPHLHFEARHHGALVDPLGLP